MQPEHHIYKLKIIDAITPMVDHPDQFGVLLMGSIAQDLGTQLSDIDALVIDFSGGSYDRPVRQLTHSGAQRCEFFFSTPARLTELSKEFTWEHVLASDPVAPRVEHVSRSLDFLLRVAWGVPLHLTDQVEEARQCFPKSTGIEILDHLHTRRFESKMAEAQLLMELGHGHLAAEAAREAAGFFLKRLVNAEGKFLTTRNKHLEEQVARSKLTGPNISKIMECWKARRYPDPQLYATELLSLMGTRIAAGNPVIRMSDSSVRIKHLASGAVITGPRGTYLIKSGYEKKVAAFLSCEEVDWTEVASQDREILREMYAHGMVEISRGIHAFRDELPIVYPEPTAPCITSTGHEWRQGYEGYFLPLQATWENICTSASEVFMSGILYANLKEDAIGAIRNAWWGAVDVCFRKMVRWVCVAALAYRGINTRVGTPLDDVWVYETIKRVPSMAYLYEVAQRALEVSVRDRISAIEAYRRVETARNLLPALLWDELERSMESGQAHQATIVDLGNVWARLRISEGTDSSSLGHDREEMARTGGAFQRLQRSADLIWDRKDDVLKELGVEGSPPDLSTGAGRVSALGPVP